MNALGFVLLKILWLLAAGCMRHACGKECEDNGSGKQCKANEAQDDEQAREGNALVWGFEEVEKGGRTKRQMPQKVWHVVE